MAAATRPEGPLADDRALRPSGARSLLRRAELVQADGARAAVLGVNDGLVSTICLILGVAGAHAPQQAVRLAGFAALVAGAVSMAAGEWVSVRSQVELSRGVIGSIGQVLATDGSAVREALSTRFTQDGMTPETAAQAAEQVTERQAGGIDVVSRALFGLNPAELGSPWTAALSSFALFAVGSIVPLAPWFLVGGYVGVFWSVGLTAAAGLAVGAVVGRSSGKPWAWAALRQLLIIVAAAAVTYGIGALFGANVS